MPQETMAEQWEAMKEEVRNAAEELVDGFPEYRAQTTSCPDRAAEFCKLSPPTDVNAFYIRKAAMTLLQGLFESQKMTLQTQRTADDMLARLR